MILKKSNSYQIILFSNIFRLEPYVKWTEPPPAWISETNEVRTVDVQMLKGSTQVPLKWNYVLSPGLVLKATKFSVVRYLTFLEEIGGLQYREDGSSHVFINEGYQTHYNISTSEVATLILNNVTEREETTFQCKLYTVPRGEWVYKIRVKLTGKKHQNTWYDLRHSGLSPSFPQLKTAELRVALPKRLSAGTHCKLYCIQPSFLVCGKL